VREKLVLETGITTTTTTVIAVVEVVPLLDMTLGVIIKGRRKLVG